MLCQTLVQVASYRTRSVLSWSPPRHLTAARPPCQRHLRLARYDASCVLQKPSCRSSSTVSSANGHADFRQLGWTRSTSCRERSTNCEFAHLRPNPSLFAWSTSSWWNPGGSHRPLSWPSATHWWTHWYRHTWLVALWGLFDTYPTRLSCQSICSRDRRLCCRAHSFPSRIDTWNCLWVRWVT